MYIIARCSSLNTTTFSFISSPSHSYDYYIHTGVGDLLRMQGLQHPLDPRTFMEQHVPLCEHVEQQRVNSLRQCQAIIFVQVQHYTAINHS
jgi:hypothetical protein